MVPRKKKPVANPETEQEQEETDNENRSVTASGKGIKLTLPISRRSGEVLIYAVSFAVVIGVIGLVIAQIITALRMTGGQPIKAVLGFVSWLSATFICAWASRFAWWR